MEVGWVAQVHSELSSRNPYKYRIFVLLKSKPSRREAFEETLDLDFTKLNKKKKEEEVYGQEGFIQWKDDTFLNNKDLNILCH